MENSVFSSDRNFGGVNIGRSIQSTLISPIGKQIIRIDGMRGSGQGSGDGSDLHSLYRTITGGSGIAAVNFTPDGIGYCRHFRIYCK